MSLTVKDFSLLLENLLAYFGMLGISFRVKRPTATMAFVQIHILRSLKGFRPQIFSKTFALLFCYSWYDLRRDLIIVRGNVAFPLVLYLSLWCLSS